MYHVLENSYMFCTYITTNIQLGTVYNPYKIRYACTLGERCVKGS